MRIAIVGPSHPFRGGIAHYTALLCNSLANEHQVKLISFSRLYPSLFFPGKTQTDSSEAKIAVDNTSQVLDSMNPLSWARSARRIKSFNPDLVIFQWWHPFFAPAYAAIARRCRSFSKVLFLCHNVIPHEKSGPTKLLSRHALRRGDLFIVHSEEDLLNLKTMLPHAVARKAKHPSYEVFNAKKISASAARTELGIPHDKKVILFFGLVREYKGLKYLIQALPEVVNSIDATLVIAGEFYDNPEPYLTLIKSLGLEHRVILKNEYVPNERVATFFAAADLLVLPYITATQSGIVQIAYGFDKPVVTTNVGGLPEVVKDGLTGYVVPPSDPKALSDAIISFFKDSDPKVFAKNIRNMQAEFSWDRMVETIEQLTSSGSQR